MKKKKIFFDYEKEEKWLNDMSKKGHALVDYKFPTYTFEASEPGEYIYRLELLNQDIHHPESQDYLNFAAEMDIEMVASIMRWVYFRKSAKKGSFEIFSDKASKINHYKRIVTVQGVVVLANFSIAISNISLGYFNNFSQYFGTINLVVGLILAYICYRNFMRMQALKADQNLHE